MYRSYTTNATTILLYNVPFLVSFSGESNEKPVVAGTDLEKEIRPNSIEQQQHRRTPEMSVTSRDDRRNRESDDEDDEQKAMVAASNPFNPALFSPGQMQAFQNAVAQFTVSAAANNMDKESLMNNVAVLQTAFFTLQQQQILQFQLIQHLQSQLLKKSGEKVEGDEEDGEQKEEEVEPPSRAPSPLKRLEEVAVELDLR